ncbi:MAG: MFS transporter [Candidatus Margulisiibacteriota bacterium]
MKKNYIIVFLLVATELIGFGLIIPVLPQISHKFTNSGVLLGLLLSSYSIAQFFSAPLLGQLSDRFGRKPILIISKIGTILSYLVLANASSYALILVSRLIDGFTGGNIAVARAYLSDITSQDHRSKAMAIIGIAFGTGFIFGPAIGSFCYAISTDFSIAGYLGAFLSLTSVLLTVIFLKEPENKITTNRQAFAKNIKEISPIAIILLFASFFGMIIFSGFETSFSIYTEFKFKFNPKENSIMFLIIGVVAFLVQGSMTKFSIKPIQKATMISLVSMGSGLILSSLLNSVLFSLASLTLLIFGVAILNTHIPAELSNEENKKGFILGIYESINSIARIAGPLFILSIFYNKIDIMYLIMGSLTLMVAIIYPLIFFKAPFKQKL